MSSRARSLLVLAGASAALGACSGPDVEPIVKDVAGLRADVQRLQKENRTLAAKLATAEDRLAGLSADLSQVRELAITVKPAPAPGSAPAAADAAAGSPESPAAGTSQDPLVQIPGAPAIRAYLATDDGKKTLVAAIEANRQEQARERARRVIDSMVDRFAKDASLSEDQSRRMKQIMEGAGEQARQLIETSREQAQDMSPEERDALRASNTAKVQEIRQKADDDVKSLLSSSQYEAYQQQRDRLTSAMRGFGGGGAAPGGNGGGGNGGGGGGRRNNGGNGRNQ